MHSTDNLDDGYLGSGLRLRRSLYKHGKKNHVLEILEQYDSREELAKREAELVNDDLLKDQLCMNLTHGGQGGIPKSILDDAEKLLSFHTLGGKISGSSEENRQRQRRRFINLHKDGVIEIPNWKGKTHSFEAKMKMSEKAKLKIGNKNSQFGTMWITNGFKNQKIKQSQLIPEGWVKGRK